MNKTLLWIAVVFLVILAVVLWMILRGDEIIILVSVRGADGQPMQDVSVKVDNEVLQTDVEGDAVLVSRAREGTMFEIQASQKDVSVADTLIVSEADLIDRSAEIRLTLVSRSVGWVRVDGEGYQLTVNNRPAGNSPRIMEVPLGPAVVRASREGFEARETTFAITNDTIRWAVNLFPMPTETGKTEDTARIETTKVVEAITPGRLSLVALPTGVIYIDGVLKRPNPEGLFELTPGKHKVIVDYPPTSKWEDEIFIKSDSVFNLLIDFNRKVKVTIAVPKDEAGERILGVEIYLDGKPVGKSPPVSIDVPIGIRTIEVRKEGYGTTNPLKKNFSQDEKESVQFILRKIP